jgi:hypothetical protein
MMSDPTSTFHSNRKHHSYKRTRSTTPTTCSPTSTTTNYSTPTKSEDNPSSSLRKKSKITLGWDVEGSPFEYQLLPGAAPFVDCHTFVDPSYAYTTYISDMYGSLLNNSNSCGQSEDFSAHRWDSPILEQYSSPVANFDN